MDDDLFGSFSAKPPTAAAFKRPISPSAPQAPVSQDSLKKLKTSQTGQTSHGQSLIVPSTTTEGDKVEQGDSLKREREREQAFAVTDEMEITAQTKVKGSVGGEIPKEGEDEGLILSHQVSIPHTLNKSLSTRAVGKSSRTDDQFPYPFLHKGSLFQELTFSLLLSRSDIKSPFLPTTLTYPSLLTYPPPLPPVPIPSNSIRFKKFQSPRFNATNQFSFQPTLQQVRRSSQSTRSLNV